MSYFKVGEECILQSKMHPELNGECTVIKVFDDEIRLTYFSNGAEKMTGGYAYYLSIKNPSGRMWDESALRKKHKPSTESLSTMIEQLNKVRA